LNVLDENILPDQRQRLISWAIHVRKIGIEVGRLGMGDEDIVPLLRKLARPTFFSRDSDFYQPTLRNAGCCLVWLEIAHGQAAVYVRRLLEHPAFNSEAKRLGNVIHVSPSGLHYWQLRARMEQFARWP